MGLLPPALLALFAFLCGNLPGSATAAGAAGGQLLLLLAAATVGISDPLRLGRAGRLLPWALVVAVAASLLASPVPRAGKVGLILLPAFLLLPGFVARCWETDRSRSLGIAGLASVLAATAAWSLADLARHGSGRAAMPRGHHNLLAAFLVILMPLVAAGLLRRGATRWLSLLALLVGSTALLATRSFLHLGILALLAIASATRFARARELVLGLGLIAVALLLPRAGRMIAGTDSSTAARSVYAEGAWRGFLERPTLGWGPGSTPWTIAETSVPRPAINPPGEIVGEAHSLPLQLLRELGATGVLLAVATIGLFLALRWRERSAAAAELRGFREAGIASLLAALASGLGADWISTPALPVAVAVGAGAALAGEARARSVPWTGLLYGAIAAALLVPPATAQLAYDRARLQPRRAEAAPHLDRAVQRDPDFPLYRARRAWTAADPAPLRAEGAIAAAREARGVAALWLRAGVLALEGGRRDLAEESFRRAMYLDPLSAFAPFQLAPLDPDPAACAARAFAAEPRLAGATLFRGSEAARLAAIERLEHFPQIDAGWRERFAATARAVELGSDDEVDLVAAIDGEPAVSLSLHAFHRREWPTDLARLRVERRAVERLRDLPPATALAGTSAEAFPRDRCLP
jgi:tetratricopeptide (TPR) repeat protein